MRVAIYARTSRAEGDDAGSVPVQVANCRELADDEGWEVAAVYEDTGITGWGRKTRPQYELLFVDAEAGRIEGVLCRDYERLLRNDKEGQRWLDLHRRTGFRHFKFADEADIDLERARDRKDWRERVAGAIYYSDRLSERVRRTKTDQVARGIYTGGEREPFGYRRVDGALEVDPEEAAVLHDVIARIARGDTLYRVTLDLNAAGLTTSRGARWRPKSLRRLLTSEHLTGARGYPPLLSDGEAAIARTALETQPPRPGQQLGRRYPLSGLLSCGECGARLVGSSGAYRCLPSAGGDGRVSIRATPLERFLIAECVRRPRERDGARRAVDRDHAEDVLAQLRAVEGEVEQTRSLVGVGDLRVADAAPILRDLGERRRALADELARSLPAPEAPGPPLEGMVDALFAEWTRLGFLPEQPAALDADFTARWESRDLTEGEVLQLREIYVAHLDRVTIARREVRGRSFDPSRVEVFWL